MDYKTRKLTIMKTPRNFIGGAIGAIALGGMLVSAPAVVAQEADAPKPAPVESTGQPDKKEAQRMDRKERAMRKVAELHQAGKHDEARKLEAKIQGASDKEAKTPAVEAAEKKAKPARVSDRSRDRRGGTGMPPNVKLQHLRQAAEHLKAAGYGPQADQAAAEAKRIETEAKRMAARPDPARPADANADLRGEIMKLRRDLDELRREVRRLKAEAPKGPPAGQPGMRRPWMNRNMPPAVPGNPVKPTP